MPYLPHPLILVPCRHSALDNQLSKMSLPFWCLLPLGYYTFLILSLYFLWCSGGSGDMCVCDCVFSSPYSVCSSPTIFSLSSSFMESPDGVKVGPQHLYPQCLPLTWGDGSSGWLSEVSCVASWLLGAVVNWIPLPYGMVLPSHCESVVSSSCLIFLPRKDCSVGCLPLNLSTPQCVTFAPSLLLGGMCPLPPDLLWYQWG